jgi:hypothetical protein
MDLQLSEDHTSFVDGLDRLLAPHRELPSGQPAAMLPGSALRRELLESGFLDVSRTDELGTLGGVLLVESVARLPVTAEIAASTLVAPKIGVDTGGRCIALAETPLTRAIRFLEPGAILLYREGNTVFSLDVSEGDTTPVKSDYFAYPMATLANGAAVAKPVDGIDADTFLTWWRVGLAAEILGSSQGAFDLTVQYVKDRRQFGRPIGSFQALQHRLAECATALEGLRALVRKAAWSGRKGDALLAATFAQSSLSRILYETHQLHGAMGLTMEYPLHYWTYRLRVLQGELGGVSAQAGAAADFLWN